MKTTTLIFFGHDGQAAKQRAAELRNGLANAFVRQADAFTGDVETADRIVLMPDVPAYAMARLEAAYAGKIEGGASVVVTETAEADGLTVGKGPRGKFYVKRAKEIITGPFDIEDDAIAAKVREASL